MTVLWELIYSEMGVVIAPDSDVLIWLLEGGVFLVPDFQRFGLCLESREHASRAAYARLTHTTSESFNGVRDHTDLVLLVLLGVED